MYQHQNKELTTLLPQNIIVATWYYENFNRIEEAIAREKQTKGGSRKAKETLINSLNPEWNDLWNIVEQW